MYSVNLYGTRTSREGILSVGMQIFGHLGTLIKYKASSLLYLGHLHPRFVDVVLNILIVNPNNEDYGIVHLPHKKWPSQTGCLPELAIRGRAGVGLMVSSTYSCLPTPITCGPPPPQKKKHSGWYNFPRLTDDPF